MFFLSVASKGLSPAASLLFAMFTEKHVSVAAKGLTRTMCWRESNWVRWEDFEGVRRTAWRARMVGGACSFPTGSESAIPGKNGICGPDRVGIFDHLGNGGQAK